MRKHIIEKKEIEEKFEEERIIEAITNLENQIKNLNEELKIWKIRKKKIDELP